MRRPSYIAFALSAAALSALLLWRSDTVHPEPPVREPEPTTAAAAATHTERPPEPAGSGARPASGEASAPRALPETPARPEAVRAGEGERAASRIVSRAPAGYGAEPLPGGTPRALTPERIRDAVDQVTGAAPAGSRERFAALALLRGRDLPEDASARLLDYLADPDRHQGMSDAAMYVFVNDLVAVFHDNPRLDDRYLEVSRSVIDDERQKEVVRDYTLQGLSRAWPNADPDQAAEILETFRAGLDRSGTSLPGTALLALDRARREGGAPTADAGTIEAELSEHLLARLAAAGTDERTRITAAGIAARTGLEEALPHLLEIAEDRRAGRTAPEKIAALSALKTLRHPRADELLHKAARSGHPLVARAAQNSLHSNKGKPE